MPFSSFCVCVPLFHLDSTITFQPSIVDQGWPRCFGRAPQLPASATVLRDANEFVAQIFQEMPIIRGISKREFVRLPWAITFMPSVSIRFLPSFSSRHPYTNLLPSNSSHHLLTKNQNGIIARNIEMQNNDIQTNDPKHVAPKKSEKRKQNHLWSIGVKQVFISGNEFWKIKQQTLSQFWLKCLVTKCLLTIHPPHPLGLSS